MKVAIGDIVQLDGGLVIVKEVETVRAFCLPMPGFRNLKADIFKHGFGVEQASRNVIERRGEAGLAAFLAENASAKKKVKDSMVTLELGDALCYKGNRCTVIAVVEDGALLEDAEGNEYEEAREINEFLFQDCNCKGHVAGRLDEAGRAENLKNHLALRVAASQAAAANVLAAAVNNNTETKKEPVMKKAKAEKAVKAVKAKKQPKAEKPKEGRWVGFTALVGKFAERSDMTDDQIIEAVQKRYPGGGGIIRILKAKRAKLKNASKA